MCSFCNQRTITGNSGATTPEDVDRAVTTALNTLGDKSKYCEIAFFGGSFTAIERGYMLSLLDAASKYTDRFQGIRISTRPDFIDDEILRLLKTYRVTAIELGAQSMDDAVLSANLRGHNSQTVIDASQMIQKKGFSLGLQMMTGLYMSNDILDMYTAEQFISLRPDTVRIYPTVVLPGTLLAKLYTLGEYSPQTLDSAVALCARLILLFEQSDINVIRVGLHSEESLQHNMLAGAYHPAFRELCENRIFLDILLDILNSQGITGGKISVRVSDRAVSKLTGHNKSNLHILSTLGYCAEIIPDQSLVGKQMTVKKG